MQVLNNDLTNNQFWQIVLPGSNNNEKYEHGSSLLRGLLSVAVVVVQRGYRRAIILFSSGQWGPA